MNRDEQIRERRAQIPKLYLGIYDRAMTGKSRKAAMHAFCLECVGWVVQEVFLCTDPGCPLYPYRPPSRASQDTSESYADEPERAKGVGNE